jgi:hypothetical protein
VRRTSIQASLSSKAKVNFVGVFEILQHVLALIVLSLSFGGELFEVVVRENFVDRVLSFGVPVGRPARGAPELGAITRNTLEAVQ